MRIINTIDEQGRYSGFKADTTYQPQADSHIISYLYARQHYYKTSKEGIGIGVKDFYKRNKEAIITKILKRYGLERIVNE